MKPGDSPNFATYLGEINATYITAAYRKYPTTNQLAKQQEARQLDSWWMQQGSIQHIHTNIKIEFLITTQIIWAIHIYTPNLNLFLISWSKLKSIWNSGPIESIYHATPPRSYRLHQFDPFCTEFCVVMKWSKMTLNSMKCSEHEVRVQ